MKTKFFFITVISIFIMSGCGHIASIVQDSNDIASTRNTTQFKTVTTSSAILTNVISNNNIGAYQILNHWNNTGIITYYDFETMSKIALSSDINNAYTMDSTAYIDSVLGGIIPIVANDSLFIIKQGSEILVNTSSENEGKARIIKMKLNGTEKKDLVVPTKINIDNFSAFLIDNNDYLYTLTYDIGTSIDDLTINLTKFNVEKSSIEKMFTFESFKNLRIIGSRKNEIIMQSTLSDKNGSTVPYIELIKFNIDTKEIVKIARFDVKNVDFVFGENYIYYADRGNQTLNKIEIETLKQEALSTDEAFENIKLYEFFDNRIIASLADNGSDINYFSIDLKCNFYPLNHFYKKDEGVNFMGIFGETVEDFIVMTEDTEIDYTMKNSAGGTSIIQMPVLNFALINKADYWNNIPNYRYFDDKVEYCNVPSRQGK